MPTGLPNLDLAPPAPMTKVVKHKYHRVTSEIVIGVAIAVGFGVVEAAPAGADPSAFSALSCSCQTKAPAGSPLRSDEIARGIREGLAAWSPGPPPQLSAQTTPARNPSAAAG